MLRASRTQQLQVARSFGHQHRGLRTTSINEVATTFWDLQEERHEADYNHLQVVTKPEALTQISLAERAIAALDTSDGADRSAFFGLLALAVVSQTRR